VPIKTHSQEGDFPMATAPAAIYFTFLPLAGDS